MESTHRAGLVEQAVRGAVAETGAISFSDLVELALYHPDGGFYTGGGRAGRRGDFLTAPEVGPLFGAVVARAIDDSWLDLGSPDVFEVVEVGAGPGTLARGILSAGPRCAAALRYVLVERSASQRALHVDITGARSQADLPSEPARRLVLANELLDNLPFGLLERTAEGWAEVRIDIDGDELVEVLVPSSAKPLTDAPLGARVPVQTHAAAWVEDACATAGTGGRVIAFDYATTTAELARRPWTEWVRTYRTHTRGGSPLQALGAQDITCEVAVDQLPPPTSNRSQSEWLRAHGIDELVADGREIWRQRAAVGDLAAVRARSRVSEAEALLDPAGLGAFRVLEWQGG
jgi:SAM-dependent MidA family methyltransferase